MGTAAEVYAIGTPWRHQDTTTIPLYGAYEGGEAEREGASAPASPGVPRPTYGQSTDTRPDLTQVVLSLGVSGDGGLPLRLGLRDGNTSDSTETPVALEEGVALGREGMAGIVADSTAYSQRTRRGRPPRAEPPQEETRYRLVVAAEELPQAEQEQGWTVLATTVGTAVCSDEEILRAYQAQNSTV